MDLANALAVSVVFLLAGGVKGVAGMGLPTVAVSLLTIWMTPLRAAGLLVVPSLFTNVAQCRGSHGLRLLRLLWPAWLALAVATVWMPVPRLPPGLHEHRLLGGILLAYGIWGVSRPGLSGAFAPRICNTPVVGVIVGAISGVVSALTAMFVLPLVPYLQALRLDKDTMVQALGISFTVGTVALAFRLQRLEQLPALSAESVLALPAALLGMWVGSTIRARISAAIFQRALSLVFIGLGAANLLRGA